MHSTTNSNTLIVKTILGVLVQAGLLFIMISSIFGFASSFNLPSVNKYQLIYTAVLVFSTIVFVKLPSHEIHRKLSYHMVLLTTCLWFLVILVEFYKWIVNLF